MPDQLETGFNDDCDIHLKKDGTVSDCGYENPRPAKPKSLKIRKSALPRLEKELRHILSALKQSGDGPTRIGTEDPYYFRKAKALLEAKGMINVISGYWDRRNPKNCRAPLYSPTMALLPALAGMESHGPIVPPEPKTDGKSTTW